MTSRFVSGGTIAGDDGHDPSSTNSAPKPPPQPAQWDREASKKNAEWEAVQKELDAERRRREEARKSDAEGGGEKSLYDILQANKAAKQAAFEEQNRIRNQFRALDDDEIDFLDTIHDERRMQEDRVKRETEARLASFREAQKTAASGPAAADEGIEVGEDSWGAATAGGRKRKREKERGLAVKGVKRRTSSGGGEAAKNVKVDTGADANAKANDAEKPAESGKTPDAKPTPAPAQAKPKLGLVDYGSDEDDDDD